MYVQTVFTARIAPSHQRAHLFPSRCHPLGTTLMGHSTQHAARAWGSPRTRHAAHAWACLPTQHAAHAWTSPPI
eukprot:350468-Chlamydomonas_euryale.AAC.17